MTCFEETPQDVTAAHYLTALDKAAKQNSA
jgi:hypothetical protein